MSERSSRHIDPPSSLPPSSSGSSQVMRSPHTPPSASTSNYSYSNTFTMRPRHDYPPALPEEPTSPDIFYNIPPPLYNNHHSEFLPGPNRMQFFSSTSSGSPPVPTSVILPERSRHLYYDPPVELQPSSSTIHPSNFTPRRFNVPSIMPDDRYPNPHNDYNRNDHHRQLPQPLQTAQPPNLHSFGSPQKPMNDSETPNFTAPTEAELRTLQRRVRELEEELGERSHLRDMLGIIPPDRAERARFREQRYCSLNRAGNALCAWHDSRRERRLYAPRMAPHRTLNCGCTYEEATFEESLSRNGVGSFWPAGDSVRMDPILRNNLLGLLQRVYGYEDGDFERNPDGTWKEGQSAAAWEEKAKHRVKRKRIIGQ